MKKLLLALMVAGACNSAFAEEFHFKIYNHSHYVAQLAQAETFDWDDKGGLDLVSFRALNANGEENQLNIKDHNPGGVPDTDYFKLRVRDKDKSSTVPVYKYVYFGVKNYTTGEDQFIIGAKNKDIPNKIVGTGDGFSHNINIDIYDDKIRASDPGTFDETVNIKDFLTPDGPAFDAIWGKVPNAFPSHTESLPIDNQDYVYNLNGDTVLRSRIHFDAAPASSLTSEIVYTNLITGEETVKAIGPKDMLVTVSNPEEKCDYDSSLSSNSLKSDRVINDSSVIADKIKANLPSAFVTKPSNFFNWAGYGFEANVVSSTSQLNVKDISVDSSLNPLGTANIYLDEKTLRASNFKPNTFFSNEVKNTTEKMSTETVTLTGSQSYTSTTSTATTTGWKFGGTNKLKFGISWLSDELVISGEYNQSTTDTTSCSVTRTYTISSAITGVPPHTSAKVRSTFMTGNMVGDIIVDQKIDKLLFHTNDDVFNLPTSAIAKYLQMIKKTNPPPNGALQETKPSVTASKLGISQTLRSFW